jgi:hypothetical protein
MAAGTIITQAAQQVQGAANALEASLPELASGGRAVLQEMLALLTSGGQAIPGQGIASLSTTTAVDFATDTAINAISPSVDPLNTSLCANGSSPLAEQPLSQFREQFKQEMERAMSHVVELPEERRSQHPRPKGVASLSDLSVPRRGRDPFVAL